MNWVDYKYTPIHVSFSFMITARFKYQAKYLKIRGNNILKSADWWYISIVCEHCTDFMSCKGFE